MSHIYISHRAIDSHQKAITRLYDQLTETYGASNVTLSSQIPPLDNTERQAFVRSHQVLIVVFGRYGLNMVDERGNLLLNDPYDPQHIEISAGLRHQLQVHTLVFDDMVDDLSEHLPDVLGKLAQKPVATHVTNATVDETIETLIESIGEIKPKAPASKPDISKMVMQPSRRVKPPAAAPQPVEHPQIQIHASRHPLVRFLRRLTHHSTTQVEHNTRPNTNRPRDESYRQMWPTSFLIIGAVIALSVFVAAMFQSGTPTTYSNAEFSLRQVATMGRDGEDVAFSADGTEVAHVTSYGRVWRMNWETMDFPDRVSIAMRSTEQIEYGMDNILVMRNDSRIFVVNTSEYDGYMTHQYVTENNAKILDMAVSQSEPIIVFMLDTGEVIRWDYSTGDIAQTTVSIPSDDNDAQIVLSHEHQLIATLTDDGLTALALDTLDQIYHTGYASSYAHIAIDNDDSRLLGLDADTYSESKIWSIDNWVTEDVAFNRSTFNSSSVQFAYGEADNLLIKWYEDEVEMWDNGRYLGHMDIVNGREYIQSIAISPDGRYLVAGTFNDTIIWELTFAD